MLRSATMRTVSLVSILATILGCLGRISDAGADPVYFMGLGDLPGGTFESRAYGISADGMTVVGSSRSSAGEQAFRWSLAGGMSGLGFLPGGSTSTAYGISDDGSVIVGGGASTPGTQAFRWTIAAGIVGIGDISGGGFQSVARGVSGDGQVIVGQGSGPNGLRGFRWTTPNGMESLPIPANGITGDANAVSTDGSITVGGFGLGGPLGQALRWTPTNYLNLGDLGAPSSIAIDVSSNGSVVTGWSLGIGQSALAFRWTNATGMQSLGLPPGASGASGAAGISADGSVIVGGVTTQATSRAFIWNTATGMRFLSDVLTSDYGLDLSGWTLGPAYGVSADGLTIVGTGTNPIGNTEAWIAHIPEPTTLSLLALTILIIGRRRRGV